MEHVKPYLPEKLETPSSCGGPPVVHSRPNSSDIEDFALFCVLVIEMADKERAKRPFPIKPQ